MSVAAGDWPSALSDTWQAKRSAAAVSTTAEIEGLIDLITCLYRQQDVRALAHDYVHHALADDRPAWAAAGRSVWALALWRGGEDDAALLQLILAELHLQEELRNPRPEPVGGPTGAGAASNNLGVAYAALEMFELAEPHLERASAISQSVYGQELALQICADLANVAETRVRWALYSEAVGGIGSVSGLVDRAGDAVVQFSASAAAIGREDAGRFAQMLDVAVASLRSADSLGIKDRDDLLVSLSLPVFGDEPGEVLMRAVTARVCRIVGDTAGCWEQAGRVAALNASAYHASTIIALHEAALAEGRAQHTWSFARAVAAESEATRRRIVTAFQARLGLAGLEQRFEEVSREHRRLQLALQDALRQEAELVHAATHDNLTGLPNRALFEQHLAATLDAGAGRHGGAAVAYVDVDDFKTINDTHGHAAGDRVLRWLAERLLASAGRGDTVARLGGDEFALLLRSDPVQWHEHDLKRELATGAPFGVTVSVGVCAVPEHATSVEEVLHLADVQMYEAKRHRKAGLNL